jgi:hypothetical protein
MCVPRQASFRFRALDARRRSVRPRVGAVAVVRDTRGTTFMDDRDISEHIESLVREEHALLERADDQPLTEAERHRLRTINVRLDQYYDLLRQRRALRSAGLDPGEAHERKADVVERYLQ